MNLSIGQGGGLAILMAGWAVVVAVVSIVLNVVFALAVSGDANRIEQRGERTVLVTGFWWTVATLFGGVFVAAVYWVMHHSTLRPSETRFPRHLDTAPTKSRTEEQQEEKIATDVLLGEPPKSD